MSFGRKTATVFGLLLIAGIGFGILSSVPALERPDYLSALSSAKGQVIIAASFQFAMATVYVLTAAWVYPTLRKHSEELALAYFGFRIVGAAALFISLVPLLLLLQLSQDFVSAGQPTSPLFQRSGELLRVGRDWLNHVGMILPWSVGGLILYVCFFELKLIPRWLSIWGLVGYSLTLAATFLLMFSLIRIVSPAYFMMNMPTALFKLVLAVFLMTKGFALIVDHSKTVVPLGSRPARES